MFKVTLSILRTSVVEFLDGLIRTPTTLPLLKAGVCTAKIQCCLTIQILTEIISFKSMAWLNGRLVVNALANECRFILITICVCSLLMRVFSEFLVQKLTICSLFLHDKVVDSNCRWGSSCKNWCK